LRRLAEILGCSVDALLAFKRGAGGAAPCDLPSESAAVRRLLDQLRKAGPERIGNLKLTFAERAIVLDGVARTQSLPITAIMVTKIWAG
jgi:hypothetical protein